MRNARRTPQEALIDTITDAFDPGALKVICEMPEDEFADVFGMDTVQVNRTGPENFYCFRDNGSDILAVAHLDTVAYPSERGCHIVNTEAGPVVHSRALDDRLGAYVLLDLLPTLGITHDVLLTVGEESGRSTAEFFAPEKDYGWMIEFDRGGTDVVMYQYDDEDTTDLVLASGADVGEGIFSDICYLEHLGVKGFNWGVGYRDYHGPRSHAYLLDTFDMVACYLDFHETNAGLVLPHWSSPPQWASYPDADDDARYDEEREHHWLLDSYASRPWSSRLYD